MLLHAPRILDPGRTVGAESRTRFAPQPHFLLSRCRATRNRRSDGRRESKDRPQAKGGRTAGALGDVFLKPNPKAAARLSGFKRSSPARRFCQAEGRRTAARRRKIPAARFFVPPSAKPWFFCSPPFLDTLLSNGIHYILSYYGNVRRVPCQKAPSSTATNPSPP